MSDATRNYPEFSAKIPNLNFRRKFACGVTNG
jgi:hypothetical protein